MDLKISLVSLIIQPSELLLVGQTCVPDFYTKKPMTDPVERPQKTSRHSLNLICGINCLNPAVYSVLNVCGALVLPAETMLLQL